jgi:hypothetical protein
MGQIPAGEGAEGSTIWSNDSTTASNRRRLRLFTWIKFSK